MAESRGDDQEILRSFIAALKSSNALTIPADTVFGAITHFLSTASGADLTEFTKALVASPILWSSQSIRPSNIAHSIRLAVTGKVGLIGKDLKNSYLATTRRNRSARKWLKEITGIVLSSEIPPGHKYMIMGLLEGLEDNRSVEWGEARAQLGEELVIAIASTCSAERLEMLSVAAATVDESRLKALDLEVILPEVQAQLLARSQNNGDSDQCAQLAKALARFFVVMDHGGPSARTQAWDSMLEFCSKARKPEAGSGSGTPVSDPSSDNWEAQKTALFSFLIPATSIVDIVVGGSPVSLHRPSELAREILLTLGSFSNLLDHSEGGLEGYHKILYGSLDIIASGRDSGDVSRLFKELVGLSLVSPAKAAFILQLGEQLLSVMDGRTLRDVLLPLCSRHLVDTLHPGSFQAAHAFMITLLAVSVPDPEAAAVQRSFLEELVPIYANILLKQGHSGDLTSEQFLAAYPFAVKAASELDPRLTQRLAVQLIDIRKTLDRDDPFKHTSRMGSILSSPYIPSQALSSHLNEVAEAIMEVPANNPHRLELASAAFKMVIQGLPDECKVVGMEWWYAWKDKIEDKQTRDEGWLSRIAARL